MASDRDVIFITIEGGPLRPHAVMDGSSKLSYPVRRGRHKDFLTEAEVANRYAQRFQSADHRAAQLTELHDEMVSRLNCDIVGWLVMTLWPSSPGSLPLRAEDQRSIPEAMRKIRSMDPYSSDVYLSGRIDYRAVRIYDDREYPTRLGILTEGGAGSMAMGQLTKTSNDEGAGRMGGSAAYYTAKVTEALLRLTLHAQMRGATGTAEVAAQLVAANGCQVAVHPGNRRPDDLRHLGQELVRFGSQRRSVRTIDISVMPDSVEAILDAVHAIASDLISEFETLDVGLINEDGTVNEDVARHYPGFHSWSQQGDLV